MNIFSNIGITELVVILLLALLVVGPERLPEMGRKLAKILRDVRKMYENLTSELGPELMTIQETTREIRESVQSVTSIPQDTVQSLVKAADLEDTIADLKGVTGSLDDVSQTLSGAGKMIKDPVGAAANAARETLMPSAPPAPDGAEEKALQPESTADEPESAMETVSESTESVTENPVAQEPEAETSTIETEAEEQVDE